MTVGRKDRRGGSSRCIESVPPLVKVSLVSEADKENAFTGFQLKTEAFAGFWLKTAAFTGSVCKPRSFTQTLEIMR